MREMIKARKSEDDGLQERSDLFSGLLAATNADDTDGQLSLTDDQLVGK